MAAKERSKTVARVRITSPEEIALTVSDITDLLIEAAQSGTLPMFSDLEGAERQIAGGHFVVIAEE